MGLNVKRNALISLETRMELDKKGVATDLQGKKLSELLQSLNKNKNSRNKEKNKEKAEQDEDMLEMLKGAHKECTSEISWQGINSMKPPFDMNSDGPNKVEAAERYENYQPGFLERIFKFLEAKKKESLLKDIEEAEKRDKVLCCEYEILHELSTMVLEGDIDSYFQVIDEMRPFDKLLKCGSSIEIGTNDSNSMEVEFKADSENVIPKSKFNKDINDEDDDSEVTYYEFVEEYVCSSILYIAKSIINLIPVNKVVVHVVDNVIDIDKGLKNDITILSIVFDRETLNKLSINTINPIDALDYFICNIRHQKTSGFKSVERIVQY